MFLDLGQSVIVPIASVLGIFDLDHTTQSYRTRAFLERAEQEGRLISLGNDLPKSFIVCQDGEQEKIYISQLSPSVLRGRFASPYLPAESALRGKKAQP